MDCSIAYVPTNVVKDSPGSDSSCSDELIPLSKLMEKPQTDEKQSRENRQSLISSTGIMSKKGRSALDDSSDDSKPLTKMKKISAPAKKPVKKDNTLTRNGKKAGDLNADDSSDNEPLVKVTKVVSKAAKPFRAPPRKSVDGKKRESLDDDASDDEPLSIIAKKLYPKRQRKTSVLPSTNANMKSKRNALRKTINYAESSNHSSDDEPTATLKRKQTKAPIEQKTSANGNGTRKKASVPKKRGTTSRKPRKMPVAGSSSNSSDDEPFRKAAKHSQVTKMIKIILKRCDDE